MGLRFPIRKPGGLYLVVSKAPHPLPHLLWLFFHSLTLIAQLNRQSIQWLRLALQRGGYCGSSLAVLRSLARPLLVFNYFGNCLLPPRFPEQTAPLFRVIYWR